MSLGTRGDKRGESGTGIRGESGTDETVPGVRTFQWMLHYGVMPREPRVVVPGLPHHITQRGNARQDVFVKDSLRRAYLELLAEHANANQLRIISYCVMTNHVHVVAIPETDASMANAFRHAHGRFSQYWNTEQRRSGHVWQNRYYSCPVEDAALDRVIAYVETNPVRARMVARAEDFAWSSARAHVGGTDEEVLVALEWWQQRWTAPEWVAFLEQWAGAPAELKAIREATYTGRPLGSKRFVAELEQKLGRRLEARLGGRPKHESGAEENQLALWSSE
jgi:putative transposase